MKNLRIKNISAFNLIDYTVFRDYTDEEINNLPNLTREMIECGVMVATFQDEKLANEFVNLYNHSNRPIKSHHFINQDWKIRFMNPDGSGKDNGECDFFIEAKEPKSQVGKIEVMMEDFGEHSGYPREQKLADAKAIVQVSALVQIAEMFFDNMKSRGEQDSIAYKLTLNTLNKL